MLRSQSDIAEDLQHYGFIEPIVNTLIGEYIKKPNPSIIHADDAHSTNEYLRFKKQRLWESVSKAINSEIELKMIARGINPNQQQFNSEEEKQAYMQQLRSYRQQNIPKEVEQYMNTEWKPNYIDWAEKTLEESETRFHLDEMYRDLFRDYLITGRCFMHWRIGRDYYRPERWSPLNTFTSITQEERYPELGEYVGRIQYLTPNQVITNFGHRLTENEKREVLKSRHYKKIR